MPVNPRSLQLGGWCFWETTKWYVDTAECGLAPECEVL